VALAQLPTLPRLLDDYPPVAAARADFLRRAGRGTEAAAAYELAVVRATTEAERRYLRRRLQETRAG
jgi:RNA polymerase sigma-70 factor (ECF subfamily)